MSSSCGSRALARTQTAFCGSRGHRLRPRSRAGLASARTPECLAMPARATGRDGRRVRRSAECVTVEDAYQVLVELDLFSCVQSLLAEHSTRLRAVRSP